MYFVFLFFSLFFASYSHAASTSFQENDEVRKHTLSSIEAVVFRHIPPSKLQKEREAFRAMFPPCVPLESFPEFPDRGLSLGHLDPMFSAMLKMIARMIDSDPRTPVIVIDIGAGNGIMSLLLGLTGADVIAIEPYFSAADQAFFEKYFLHCQKLFHTLQVSHKEPYSVLMKAGRDILAPTGSTESFSFRPATADFVIASNLLHMFSPAEAQNFTRKVTELLKPNGILYLSVDDLPTDLSFFQLTRDIYPSVISLMSFVQPIQGIPETYKTSFEIPCSFERTINEQGKTARKIRLNERPKTLFVPFAQGLKANPDIRDTVLALEKFCEAFKVSEKILCYYTRKMLEELFPTTAWGRLSFDCLGEKWRLILMKRP